MSRLPLPIAFVTTELRPGGAERNLVALAAGLDRGQFRSRVYSLAPRPPGDQRQLVKLLDDAAVEVNFIGVEKSRQFFTAVRRLRRLWVTERPALVQSFLFHANVVSAVAARKLGVPVVAGLRVAQRERLRAFVERRLSRHIKAFVCVSQGVANVAHEVGGIPREKLHVIPNGIDPRRFNNVTPADLSRFGIQTGHQVVLFLGRLDRQKGADVLIEAAREFLSRAPDSVLLIVGEGPEKAELTRQAETISSERIIFAPWQPDPLPLIAAAGLVAIPSRWEGMPNVLLEAAALGRPFVASDVEGVKEILPSQADDRIVPPEQPSALAAAILQTLSAGESQTVTESILAHVFENYALKNSVRSYADLYRAILGGNPA